MEPQTEITPRDQTRPMSSFGPPASDVAPGNSFADLPDAKRDAAPEPDPEPAAEPEPKPSPAANASPPPVPQNVGQQVAEALDLIDRRRRDEWIQQQQQQAYNQQMQTAWEPPPIPENMDEYLADGGKMRELLTRQAESARTAIAAAVAPLASQVQGMNGALTVAYQRLHAAEWERAARIATERGIDDPNRFYGAVDAALRANPNNYWDLATNGQAMAKAIELVATQGEPQDRPMRPFASATTGGQRNVGRRDDGDGLSQHDREALAKVEQLMGIKIDKQGRRDYAETMRRRNGGR